MNKLIPILKHLFHAFNCGCSEFVIKHKSIREHGESRIYLECIKCNYETEGMRPNVRRNPDSRIVDTNNISA